MNVKERFYPRYVKFRKWESAFFNRYTQTGILLLIFLLFTFVFGLNTMRTTIYILFTTTLSMLVVSIVSTLKFRPDLSVKREISRYAMVGEKVRYSIRIKNNGKKAERGLYLREIPGNAIPSLREFLSTKEPGEEKRNIFDRTMGFYRWKWLIDLKSGAKLPTTELPEIAPGRSKQVSVELIPQRRGVVDLKGVRVHHTCPFGLTKKGIEIIEHSSILVLPKIFPLETPMLPGSRKFHPGGVSQASKVGNAEEFVSVREYRPGDPLKHIHWKSFARTGTLMVKEFYEEFFSRRTVILDSCIDQFTTPVFEAAVSLAASFLHALEGGDDLKELITVTKTPCALTVGRGVDSVDHLLEELASIGTSGTNSVEILKNSVKKCVPTMSGALLILLKIDEERKKIISLLESARIPHRVFLVSEDPEAAEERMKLLKMPEITILNSENIEKEVGKI